MLATFALRIECGDFEWFEPAARVEIPPCGIGHVKLEPAMYGIAVYQKKADGVEDHIVDWRSMIHGKDWLLDMFP